MEDLKAWRQQAVETALEPDLRIIDAHHHVWSTPPVEPYEPYELGALIADITGAGHNVVATVETDSHAYYRTDGPEHLRVVGETEFFDRAAEKAQREGPVKGLCAGIVANANLTMGAAVGEVLDAHMAASRRFRGIRHMTAYDPTLPAEYTGSGEAETMEKPAFREGFAELGRRGLTYDAWLFQTQLLELADLAAAVPETGIVLDHCGGPLAIGRYEGKPAEAFEQWRRDLKIVAQFPQISCKIGALNMPHTGVSSVGQPRPDSSERAAQRQRDLILTTIDIFGAERCMFESNFPVDMRGTTYTIVWNVFKRVTTGMTASERNELFYGTANRVYRLGLPA